MEGDFRSNNIHRAGKIMGLHLAGVDILRSNHGPVVMEVNSSPGLHYPELDAQPEPDS